MSIKKILFEADFESLRFDTLQSLLDLRKSGLDHVVLLYIINPKKITLRRILGKGKEETARSAARADVRFSDWAETLFQSGIEVGSYIRSGDRVPQFLFVCEKEKADLIVTSDDRKAHPLRLFRRPNEALETARKTSTPVLVYARHTQERTGENPFRRPLFALDRLSAPGPAAGLLAGLKNNIEELILVHVISKNELRGKSKEDIQEIHRLSRIELGRAAARLQSEGINTRAHLYAGEVAGEIITAAREYQATMIVAGPSGRESRRGDISPGIAGPTDIPVLLVV